MSPCILVVCIQTIMHTGANLQCAIFCIQRIIGKRQGFLLRVIRRKNLHNQLAFLCVTFRLYGVNTPTAATEITMEVSINNFH